MSTDQPVNQDEVAAMAEVIEAGALSPNGFDEFLQTGRTGRRNALPDILDKDKATVGMGELPSDLDKLSCSDASQAGASTSDVVAADAVPPADEAAADQSGS